MHIFFGNISFNYSVICERMQESAFLLKDLTVELEDVEDDELCERIDRICEAIDEIINGDNPSTSFPDVFEYIDRNYLSYQLQQSSNLFVCLMPCYILFQEHLRNCVDIVIRFYQLSFQTLQ